MRPRNRCSEQRQHRRNKRGVGDGEGWPCRAYLVMHTCPKCRYVTDPLTILSRCAPALCVSSLHPLAFQRFRVQSQPWRGRAKRAKKHE